MFQRAFTLVVLLSIFFHINAQHQYRYWRDGKLSWSDFQVKEAKVAESSHLAFQIFSVTDKQYGIDTTFISLKAETVVNKDKSWVNASQKNVWVLAYNQVIFDIAELYRRQLQIQLNEVATLKQVPNMVKNALDGCQQEVAKFKIEVPQQDDSTSIQRWESVIRLRLNYIDDAKVVTYQPGNWGFGVNGGAGSSQFNGAMADYFQPTWNVNLGVEGAYKRTMLYLNTTISSSYVKQTFDYNGTWEDGTRASFTIIDAALGYAVIDNNRWKLVPNAGAGYTILSTWVIDSNLNENRYTLSDLNAIGGITVDYKLQHRINKVPNILFRYKEESDLALRARFYVAKADFNNTINGYTFNVAIGISRFGHALTVR
jgi:hypothetical protein